MHSVLVLPLVQGEQVVGFFELFSWFPSAFTERDERTLEALGARVLQTLQRATQPIMPAEAPAIEQQQEPEVSDPENSPLPDKVAEVSASPWSRDLITWGLGMAVLASTVLLAVLISQRVPWGTPKEPIAGSPAIHQEMPAPTPAPPSAAPTQPVDQGSGKLASETVAAQGKPAGVAAVSQSTSHKRSTKEDSTPLGGLSVFENGKEVFRLPPQNRPTPLPGEQGSAVREASIVQPEAVVGLSPGEAEDSVVRRVEPEYPEQARLQGIQGVVVLDIHVAQDGRVQDVKHVSGPPPLIEPAVTAVRQWQFKPRRVNGKPVEMQTQVTLDFRLPQ